MKSPVFFALSLTLSLSATPAFAGSMSLDCVSRDKSIQVGAGNSDIETQIKYVDKDGKPGELKVPGNIQPDFDFNDTEEKAIFLVPIGKKTNVKEKHQTMKVTRKDGTFCYGRQAWDDTYTQAYVVTGKGGRALNAYGLLPYGAEVPGMNADGYVVAKFACHSYGITTAGGCFVENDDDIIEWIDDDKLPPEGK